MVGVRPLDRQGKFDWARQARFQPFDKAVVYFNISRAAGPANSVKLSAGPCGEQFASQCDLPADEPRAPGGVAR